MYKKYLKLLAFSLSIFAIISCSDDDDNNSTVGPNDDDTTSITDSTDNSDSTVTPSDSSNTDVGDSITWAPIEIEYAPNIIDDFEDRNGATAQGGGWYSFASPGSDIYVPMYKNAEGGREIVPTGEGYESDYSLRITYALHKADYEWAPYAAIGATINEDEKFDASDYVGIKYFYRGAAHVFRTEINAVTDYDVHVIDVEQSDEWKEMVVAFEDLQQEGWGDPVDFDPSDIRAVAFSIVGEDGDTSFLEIDEIEFLDTIIVELQYDMEIKDPVIPDLKTLNDISSITTSLQEKAMKDLNKGVNLTNWLEEDAIFDGTFRYDEERIAKMASQGFKAIRMPIDIDKYVVNRDEVLAGTAEFSIDSLIFTPLDSMVAWTERYNMSLTIDYHQYDGSLTKTSVSDPLYMEMVSNCWKSVAQKYADSRDNIYYELTNEPGIGDAVPSAAWQVLAKQMLDSIRSVDTKHTVIYGETRWYDIDQLIKFTPFDDDNVIYSFHNYSPFIFTHMGASWGDMGSTKNIPFPYSKEEWSTEYSYFGFNNDIVPDWTKTALKNYYQTGNKNTIKNEMIDAKNWAIEHNVVVICNEFGAYTAKAKNEHIVNYLTTVREVFDELQIPWQVWFGTFENDGELIEGVGEALDL